MRWSEARGLLPNIPWNPYQAEDAPSQSGAISRVYNWFFQKFPVGWKRPKIEDLFPEEGREELLKKLLKTVFPAVANCGRLGFENRIERFLEDEELWRDIGIPPRKTRYTFYFAKSLDDMDCYVRALALCYTLSTFLPSEVAEMGEIYKAVPEHRLDGFMDSWFLIVTNPMTPYNLSRFCTGDVVSLFERRRRLGKMTTFVDMERGSEHALRELVANTLEGALGRILSDPHVYYIF